MQAGRFGTHHRAPCSQPSRLQHKLGSPWWRLDASGHNIKHYQASHAHPLRMHAQPSKPQQKQGTYQASHAHRSQNACTRSRHSLPDPNTSREVHGASREPQDATYSTSKTPQSYKLEPAHCELRQKHACARRMYCKRILVEQMFVVRLHLKDDKAIKEHKQNADQNDGPQCNFVWRERMGYMGPLDT